MHDPYDPRFDVDLIESMEHIAGVLRQIRDISLWLGIVMTLILLVVVTRWITGT